MGEPQGPASEREPGLRLALHQPDRPHNFGAALRLCACLGVRLDVIEPCGFPLDDRRIRMLPSTMAGTPVGAAYGLCRFRNAATGGAGADWFY